MACDDFAAKATDRIVIQSPTETTDSYGARSVSWATVGTYWAHIKPASGREIFAQQTTQSRCTHSMVIRYQSVLKDISVISDYRISFDDRLFAVNAIRNLAADMKSEGKEFQEILAEENAPDVHG